MLDMACTCRTCMKGTVTLIDVFQSVKLDNNCYINIAEMLKECTTAQVTKEDGLPQKICSNCLNTLQLSYTFRNQTLKAEQELKKLISLQISVKDENVDIEMKNENLHDYLEYDNDFDFDTLPKCKQEDVDYEYNNCGKQFIDEKKHLKHVISNSCTGLSCSICKKTFRKQTSLDNHTEKHHPYKCKICSLNLSTKSLLLEHVTTHTGDEVKTEYEVDVKFQCSQCDMSFNKPRSLAMHLKKHNKKDKERLKFVCDICNKSFLLKTLLRRHLRIHSTVRPYKCTKCPKAYSRQDQLVNHINKHNGCKPYTCSFCKKGFTQQCSLKDHLRTHTGETPFLCSECGRGFANSSNLRQHMLRHSGVKAYACNMCPKTFVTKGQMTSHMKTHTGEHPYKCAECGATFTKSNSLKKHSYIHLGLRPFVCDNCNMRFTCKDHLKRHYRIHTGEKPYKCKVCDRAFTQSNDLMKHLRSHFGKYLYKCTVCNTGFKLASELKLHYPVHFNGGQKNILEQRTDEDKALQPDNGVNDEAKIPNRFTITINNLDENGQVGEFTVNISSEGS